MLNSTNLAPLQDLVNHLLNWFSQHDDYKEQLLLTISNLSQTQLPDGSSLHTLCLNLQREAAYCNNDDALDLQCDAIDHAFAQSIVWAKPFLLNAYSTKLLDTQIKLSVKDDSTMLRVVQITPTGQTIYRAWFHAVLADSSIIITLIDYPQ